MRERLPGLGARRGSEAAAPSAPQPGSPAQPPLLGGSTCELASAKPGTIINTASLEGLSHAVYTMAVHGSKLYSGLFNGNIQVWHMDAYVNLPSGSRPEYHTLTGHTSSIYALLVTERQLISASQDKLVKIWDLNTMRCRHTLKGHNSRVRALALSGRLLFTGSNDKSIKVPALHLFRNIRVAFTDIQPFAGLEPGIRHEHVVAGLSHLLDTRTRHGQGCFGVEFQRQHCQDLGPADNEVHFHIRIELASVLSSGD